MPGKGLLLVMTDIPADIEQEFNKWYNEQHMDELLKFPGILSARRYRTVDGKPKYRAMDELEDPEVVERPDYQKISGWSPTAHPLSISMSKRYFNTIRGVYRLGMVLPSPEPADVSKARGLMLRGLAFDPAHIDEIMDWYHTEHLPRLCRVPGCVRGRRYDLNTKARDLKGNPPPSMAVYELETPEVQATKAWSEAAGTPWTEREKRFFREPSLRNVYTRIYPA